jgi:hypothetical protein
MADELEGIPGVVAPGPDGMKRVDTGRLTMANASETGKLRREMDELRSTIAALEGDPDATLAAVNREQPKKARRARAGDAEVAIGDISVEGDSEFGGDWSSLESAGRNEQAIMGRELQGRKVQDAVDYIQQYREQGLGDFIQEQPASADSVRDDVNYQPGVTPYDTEMNANPGLDGSRIPQSDAEQSSLLRQQYAEASGERPADDFDSRNRADVLAQGNGRGWYGTGPERATAVDEFLADNGIHGPFSPEAAAQLARQMNYDQRTHRLVGNIQPGEILEAMKRRTELAL